MVAGTQADSQASINVTKSSCTSPVVMLSMCIENTGTVCKDAVRGNLAAAASSFASSSLLLCSLKVPSAAVHSSFCSQVKYVIQGNGTRDGEGGWAAGGVLGQA